MKTKTLIIALLGLLAVAKSQAQEGTFLVTVFDPPLTTDSRYTLYDTISLDLDHDGTIDYKYYWDWSDYYHTTDFLEGEPQEGWYGRKSHVVEGGLIPVSIDTFSYFWYAGYNSLISGLLWWEYEAYCKKVGDKRYYGWAHFNWVDSVYVNYDLHIHKYTFFLDKMVFCTIPDYPLRAGQTSFDYGTKENSTTPIASFHPNPTAGLVAVTGNDLRRAEVFNLLGQKVATVDGGGKQLTIDLSELPPGIYLVNVADHSGKTCVGKVVKR